LGRRKGREEEGEVVKEAKGREAKGKEGGQPKEHGK